MVPGCVYNLYTVHTVFSELESQSRKDVRCPSASVPPRSTPVSSYLLGCPRPPPTQVQQRPAIT